MEGVGWKGRSFIIVTVLELVALGLWIGGLIVIIGAVIPAVFNIGMEAGGRLLTRIFDGYNRLVMGAVGVLVCTWTWRAWAGKRGFFQKTAVHWGETILLTLMIGIASIIIGWLGPDSVALQEQAFTTEGVEAKKAAYEAFFRSHTVVRGLYLVNLVLGIALLTVKVGKWREEFSH